MIDFADETLHENRQIDFRPIKLHRNNRCPGKSILLVKNTQESSVIWQIDFVREEIICDLVKLIFAHEKLHGNNVWPDTLFFVRKKKLNGIICETN